MLAHKNHSETFLITRHTLKRLQQLPCSQHPWLGSKKIKEKSGKQETVSLFFQGTFSLPNNANLTIWMIPSAYVCCYTILLSLLTLHYTTTSQSIMKAELENILNNAA